MKRRRGVSSRKRMNWRDDNRRRSSGSGDDDGGGVEKLPSDHVTVKNGAISSEKSCESSDGYGTYVMTIILFIMVIGLLSLMSLAYFVGNSLLWFVVWLICHAYFLKLLREQVLMAAAAAGDEKEIGKGKKRNRQEDGEPEDGRELRKQQHFFWDKIIDGVIKSLLKYGRAYHNREAIGRGGASGNADMSGNDYGHQLYTEDDEAEEEDGDDRKELGQTLEWEIGGRRHSLVRQLTLDNHTISEEAMVQALLLCISDSSPDTNVLNPKWTIVRERHGITIWTSESSVSASCPIRGRMVCSATPTELLSLLIDDNRIGEYDNLFDKVVFSEILNDRTIVRRTCYRSIWPTRPRDFVIKTTWEEFADGSVVIATKSIDRPDCPENPTYTRGKMFMCGFVIVPLCQQEYPAGSCLPACPDPPFGHQYSEITMYAHTDLGGNLPASIINRLSKKPAHRVLRKIQKMVVNKTLVSKPEPRASRSMSLAIRQYSSVDTLRDLLEDVDELNCSQEILYPMDDTEKFSPRMSGERTVDRTSHTFTTGASINKSYAMAKAMNIMEALERMASDSAMKWVELLRVENSASDGGTFLYKSNVPGSSKINLGACSIILTAPEELLGLLLETAAMLGPDYKVENQEVIETLQSEVGSTTSHCTTGDQKGDDTTIFWFTCIHKRQRIHRDFVIPRCFRALPGGGGLIAYSSVEHPAFPSTPAFARGKIQLCGFVVVPKPPNGCMAEEEGNPLRCSSVTYFTSLRFSEYLPAFEDLQVSYHFMGPLHVLEELKRALNDTLYSVDEEVRDDDAYDVPICSTPTLMSRQSSLTLPSGHVGKGGVFEEAGSSSVAFEETFRSAFTDDSTRSSCSSQSIISPVSPSPIIQCPVRSMGSTTHSMVSSQKVAQMHEAAVRDLLALASEGEYMGDGPQVDWILKQDCNDLKLWSSKLSECGWRVSS